MESGKDEVSTQGRRAGTCRELRGGLRTSSHPQLPAVPEKKEKRRSQRTTHVEQIQVSAPWNVTPVVGSQQVRPPLNQKKQKGSSS